MKKRMIALLLCCVMVLTLSPSLIATAAADDDTDAATAVEEPVAETKDETKVEEQVKEPKAEEPKEEKAEETKAETSSVYTYLMAQKTAEDMLTALRSLSEEQLATLTAEQAAEVEAYINQLIPPADLSDIGDTVVAGDETVTGPSEIRRLTHDFTKAAPFGAPVKGATSQRMLKSGAATLADDKDDGLKTEKSFTFKSGSTSEGTIRLEAWATGESTQISTKKEIPTDIILVLDQSGSMGDAFDTVTDNSYRRLSNNNMQNYPLRQNGGSDNIWYKLDDNRYVRVNMKITQNTEKVNWESCIKKIGTLEYLWNSDMVSWSDEGVLYQKLDDGTYARCYVTGGILSGGYDYHYADGTIEHVGIGDNPKQVDINRFWHATGLINTYHYFYVDDTGAEKEIETSEGDNTTPANTYYQLVTTTQDRTKLDALQDAVNSFAEAVAEKAKGADGTANTSDDVAHRIAIVGFASGDTWNGASYNYNNTEVFIGADQYKYGNAAKGQYKNAFQDMRTSAGVKNITASVNALASDGGTLTNLGLEMANGIFAQNSIPSGTERNRVVIVFTDGQPGWSGYNSATANSAVSQANIAKNTYGATVYTVGIFEGANVDGTDATNTFMRDMASSGVGHYLTASDSNALNEIFQTISQNINTGGSYTQLDDKTVVKDVMSDCFRLPDGVTKNDIKVYTAAVNSQTGKFEKEKPFNDANVTVDTNNQTVSVTNFNFSQNWVGKRTVNNTTTYGGKKLIIEFTVKLRSGFLGGNNVPTNGDTSGVYDKDEKEVKKFDVPTVNIPIGEVNVTAQEKNVYLLGGVTAEKLKSDATVTVGGVKLDLNKASDTEMPWGLDPWKTKYVDITVAVQDEAGNAVPSAGLTKLTADTTYTLTATVSPKNAAAPTSSGDEAKQTGKDDDANIYVFKPVVTFKDSQITLGESADYTKNLVSAVWKHDKVESTADTITMIGEKPKLEYGYNPDTGIFKTDTPVKATVKIKGTVVTDKDTDVTENVTFKHDCTIKDNCTLDAKDGQFIVHVKPLSLTIKKTVESELDANQSFVFVVSNDRKDSLKISGLEVIVHGDGSVTLNGLPTGTYTVTEKTGWSWRYQPTANDQDVELTAANDSVTFANTRNKSLWLTGGTYCDNRFDGQGTTVTPTSN